MGTKDILPYNKKLLDRYDNAVSILSGETLINSSKLKKSAVVWDLNIEKTRGLVRVAIRHIPTDPIWELAPQGPIDTDMTRFNFTILKDSSNYLVHRDILRHQLSKKQGTVSTKTRSEVRGGGKKPWQQKGTGRARAGSSSSPLWKGGGVIFGPKPKKIILKLNKKERKLAVKTALYNKFHHSGIIIPNLELIDGKTKAFSEICRKSGINLDEKLLVIVSKKTMSLKLATQNLKNVELLSASNLNTLSIVKAKTIVFTKTAINDIEEIYSESKRK